MSRVDVPEKSGDTPTATDDAANGSASSTRVDARGDGNSPDAGRSEPRSGNGPGNGTAAADRHAELLRSPVALVQIDPDGGAVVIAVSSAGVASVGDVVDDDRLDELVYLLDDAGGPSQFALLVASGPASGESEPNLALIIDDEATNREYYRAAFESIGWKVEVAGSGAAGVTAFASSEPAVALVDVRLPDMNGYDVSRQLRTIDRRQCYVVLMSADPTMVEPQRAANAGADLGLVGPIGGPQLKAIIEQRTTTPARVRVPTNERRTSTAVKLQLFGEPEIHVGERWVPIPVGAATDIISVLAIHHPSVLSTGDLGELAWSPPATSASPVHTALSRLRNTLAKQNVPEIVVTSQQGYRLDVRASNVDTLAFEHTTAELDPHALSDEVYVRQAGRILDGISDTAFGSSRLPVVEAARVRIWEARAVLEERTSVRLILLGETVEAISVSRRLTARELWRESAWTILIAALYHSGRQREALETYQVARNLLVNSVGVDPSPALRDIESRVLNQDPVLNDPDFIRDLAR